MQYMLIQMPVKIKINLLKVRQIPSELFPVIRHRTQKGEAKSNLKDILGNNIQIKHKVDYLLGYKLYLHPFDHVEGCRPETGQSDISTVYRPSK